MLTRACALVVRAGICSLPDSGYEESVFVPVTMARKVAHFFDRRHDLMRSVRRLIYNVGL
jgi:phage regulator Rha-like protein